ncbi:hypothetical protein IGB42_04282 [Andreprevotia sp. IGB-42]|nr:hypothetical protein IGB42_04282 [Andreprevotia sp. IGB-42]
MVHLMKRSANQAFRQASNRVEFCQILIYVVNLSQEKYMNMKFRLQGVA